MKRIGAGLVWLLILLLLAPVVLPPFLDRVYYRGPVTAHFDGAHFHNPDRDDRAISPLTAIRVLLGRGRAPWPSHVDVVPAQVPPRVGGAGDPMLVTWVGHSTVLVQTAGLNILTDPVWSESAGVFGLFGPVRVRDPGIRFDDLPKIDLVLLSHDHYDHMDLVTLKRLWRRDRPLIVTSLGNDTILKAEGIGAVARDWGGRVAVRPARRLAGGTVQSGVDVIVDRVHHWGSRWGVDRNRALWSGFTVTLPGGNLFFAGDTGWGDGRWVDEAARNGPYRLALIPIGAVLPRPMMAPSHIGPAEAVAVFRKLHASYALGVHWGTFPLSYEALDDPPRWLSKEESRAGLPPGRFRTLDPGRSWLVPASSP